MGTACMLVLGSQMGGEEEGWALASVFPVCPRRGLTWVPRAEN